MVSSHMMTSFLIFIPTGSQYADVAERNLLVFPVFRSLLFLFFWPV